MDECKSLLRDPTCVAHAEDLQAGSSYNIPANTQQAFGRGGTFLHFSASPEHILRDAGCFGG